MTTAASAITTATREVRVTAVRLSTKECACTEIYNSLTKTADHNDQRRLKKDSFAFLLPRLLFLAPSLAEPAVPSDQQSLSPLWVATGL